MPVFKEPSMVAPKRPASPVSDSAAAVIAREMPEWQIATQDTEADLSLDENTMKIDQGPSIAKLRRKFGVTDSGPGEPDFAPVDDTVETVRIEPKSGGAPKTADIKNGKVTIVQG